MNKKWLLIVFSAVITIFIWNSYAFTKAYCPCPWNEWNFIIASIVGTIVLMAQIFSGLVLIKNAGRKFYLNYIYVAIASVIIQIITMRTFLYFLA